MEKYIELLQRVRLFENERVEIVVYAEGERYSTEYGFKGLFNFVIENYKDFVFCFYVFEYDSLLSILTVELHLVRNL